MKKKMLLYGIGSYKNRGVEAIVQSALNQLPKDAELDIACYDIDYNKEKYRDKVHEYINHRTPYEVLPLETRLYINELAEKKNFFEIESIYQKETIEKIPKYDICISAGGDNYCYDANDWLFAIDRSVKKNNKKLVLFGASLYEKINNEELLRDLDMFDVLHIRESISYNELKKYISEDKLILAPDTAFSLPAKKVKLDKWYKGRKVVGINMSPTIIGKKNIEERTEAMVKIIQYILDNTKYSISLISHVTIEESNDYKTLSIIYEKFKGNDRVFLERDKYDCNELKYIISKCELMIAARTHASIAAYSSFVPTLVLGYSVKSKGIATDLFGTDKNYVVAFDDLNYENLVEKFNYLNNNKKQIKKRLEEIIPYFRKRSLNSFNSIMEKLELQEKKAICDKKDCINCNICKKVCPKDAIDTIEASLHFKYNKRNLDKCINCGKCLKMCPAINQEKKDKFSIITYAAKNKNIDIQKKSTSGGVFTAIAEYILNKKGIVYGTERVDNKTSHIRVTNKKDLSKLRGSKYSYSSLDNVLDSIQNDIKNKKYILFSGTPCQIGAIKKLVGDYKKIIYISVICHGVLNDQLVDDYCDSEELKLIDYRTKKNGWLPSSIKYDKYTKKFMDDKLMALYVYNVILRESCYRCKYTIDNNAADIILGDYWGIKEVNEKLFDNNGVSIIIINSKRGKKIFDNIKDNLEYSKTSSDNLEIIHPNLFKPAVKPKERFIIDDLLKNNTWDSIYELNIRKNKIIELNREIERLNGCLYEKDSKLISIMNSRRWRVVDKISNGIRKIIK